MAANATPQGNASRIVAVANKRLPGISIYDLDSLELLGSAQTGIAPHEVALSADGRFAYLPIYGSSGVGKPGTSEHELHIYETPGCREVAVIETGDFKRLHSITVGGSGLVYVTAEDAAAVIVIDPAQGQVIGHIPTGSYTTHMLALNKAETKIFCSNVQSKTVSVLDVPTRRLEATIPTAGENQRMTLSPDERWFVTHFGAERRVGFFRTSDHQLDFQVQVSGAAFVSKFDSEGSFLFCAGMQHGATTAWKIDVRTREVVGTVPELGSELGSIEVNPFDGTVWVSDQPTNTITILDPNSFEPIRKLRTPPAPDAMAFAQRT